MLQGKLQMKEVRASKQSTVPRSCYINREDESANYKIENYERHNLRYDVGNANFSSTPYNIPLFPDD